MVMCKRAVADRVERRDATKEKNLHAPTPLSEPYSQSVGLGANGKDEQYFYMRVTRFNSTVFCEKLVQTYLVKVGLLYHCQI